MQAVLEFRMARRAIELFNQSEGGAEELARHKPLAAILAEMSRAQQEG